MDWEKWIRILSCPICQGELVYNHPDFHCDVCEKNFPVRFDIPDFRVFPPHHDLGYMTQEEDLRVSAELFDLEEKRSFEDLVRTKISREGAHLNIDQNLQEVYIQWRLDNHPRALQFKKWIQDHGISCDASQNGCFGLDIGCGAGSGMATLLEMTEAAVGFDITISDLILARSFLNKYYPGRDYLLFAGVAEHLPLANDVFSLVLARDVMEHVSDPRLFLKEAHRVMVVDNYFLFNTGSRFLLIEPHTRLPGVGFLPRVLQPIYVRLIRHSDYKVHLPSLWELRRHLNDSPFDARWEIISSKRLGVDKEGTKQRGLRRTLLGLLRHLEILNMLNRLLAHISYYEIIMKK